MGRLSADFEGFSRFGETFMGCRWSSVNLCFEVSIDCYMRSVKVSRVEVHFATKEGLMDTSQESLGFGFLEDDFTRFDILEREAFFLCF